MSKEYRVGIGQDSHRFAVGEDALSRVLTLAGKKFPGEIPLLSNSDGDVIFHALCNAISGVSLVNILGGEADRLLNDEGVKDSAAYVRAALDSLREKGYRVVHASVSIECKKPIITPIVDDIREGIAKAVFIRPTCVGVTATSGEDLTPFGQGLGIQVICAVTCEKRRKGVSQGRSRKRDRQAL